MANKKRYYPLRSSTDPKKVKLVEITEEQYQAIYPEIWATIKREQRQGRCRCPVNYLWTCNGYCSDCSYHTGGNEESIDELTETAVAPVASFPVSRNLSSCAQNVTSALTALMAESLKTASLELSIMKYRKIL